MVYTTELASPMMRGLISSSTAAGTTIGFILGSAAAWLVNVMLTTEQVPRGAGGFRSSAASCSASPAGSCAEAFTRPKRDEGRGRPRPLVPSLLADWLPICARSASSR
jgi:hypothetical protein